MDLQADIKWISQELKTVKDSTLIEAFKNMLKYRTKKKGLGHISIEQYNNELNQAEKEIESGDFFTTDELREKSKEWGRK